MSIVVLWVTIYKTAWHQNRHFNIILSSTRGSCKWSLSFRFFDKNVARFPRAYCMCRLASEIAHFITWITKVWILLLGCVLNSTSCTDMFCAILHTLFYWPSCSYYVIRTWSQHMQDRTEHICTGCTIWNATQNNHVLRYKNEIRSRSTPS
jgi:hypothetical protein